MKPETRFLLQPKSFWAHIRSISEIVGYTHRGQNAIKVPTVVEMVSALRKLGLGNAHIGTSHGEPTEFGQLLHDYFSHRASTLNNFVEPRLMDVERAREVFHQLCARCEPPEHFIPMNKQKGDKKAPAYFTGMVNMLVREGIAGFDADFDPRALTTVTRDGQPLRTLARRVDGAFPTRVNPVAVWEIKEYYYTTTFGSRVADGIYETLLDGMELEELREHEGVDVKHYLMIDSHFTWWECGRSYLCRLIDMLHMGYVDEVLFGYEVIERLPEIVAEWTYVLRQRADR